MEKIKLFFSIFLSKDLFEKFWWPHKAKSTTMSQSYKASIIYIMIYYCVWTTKKVFFLMLNNQAYYRKSDLLYTFTVIKLYRIDTSPQKYTLKR